MTARRTAEWQLDYTLRVGDPASRIVAVDARFHFASTPGAVDVVVTDTDAHYTAGYAQFVDSVQLADADGTPVELARTAPNRWHPVSPLGPGDYRLTYTVRIDHASKQNAWGLKETPRLGADGGVLVGAAVFLFPRVEDAASPLEGADLTVRWELPPGWRALAPWPRGTGDALAPASVDDLLDNFLFLAPSSAYDVFTLAIGGSTVTGAVRRGAWAFDNAALWRAFERAIRQSASIFGELPQPSYLLVVDPWPGTKTQPGTSSGGGAARESFHAMLDEKHTAADLAGPRPLRTLAHETFHWWNPAGFPPAVPADLYWWNEGVTVYYESLVLWRAGIISRDEFFTALAEQYDRGERRNGVRPATSLVEASRKVSGDGGPEYDAVFSLGAVFGFALDVELRERSGGAQSLDRLMQALYARYKRTRRGFAYEDLVDEATLLAGSDMRPFFARYVEGHEPYDWPALLRKAGYVEQQQASGHPYLGVTYEPQAAAPTVRGVQPGAPAEGALEPGDVVLALGATPTPTVADFSRAIGVLHPGDAVAIRFRRAGREGEAHLVLAEKREVRAVPLSPEPAGARALLDALGRAP